MSGARDHRDGEFTATVPGRKRKTRLKREIAWALTLKFAALLLIWYAFFSHPARMDGERVGAGVYSSGQAASVSGQGTAHARP